MVKPIKTRLPEWLRTPYKGGNEGQDVRRLLDSLQLNTVCQSARCPNQCECWKRRTATFMIMGEACTRNCRFCAVDHACRPLPLDPDEPERVARAAAKLNLKFVVVTSVTRDDLPDGGAWHFARTVQAVREKLPGAGIEILTPDFRGAEKDLATVIAAAPTVFNHNLETCERLTGPIRSGADYRRSLLVLAKAAELGKGKVMIKSGIMLGLGETADDIRQSLRDLRDHGVQILTIGQYLPPSSEHWPLAEYVTPEAFDQWGRIAKQEYGFQAVASAPLVRSSYLADLTAEQATTETTNPH